MGYNKIKYLYNFITIFKQVKTTSAFTNLPYTSQN